MGHPLKNQPIFLALIQVQFEELSILNKEESISKIQEIMRTIGYPVLEPRDESDQKGNVINTTTFYSSKDKRSSFAVNTKSIVFRTINYTTSDELKSNFEAGLSQLIMLFKLESQPLLRVGMRYLDLVKLADGENSLAETIKPELLGLGEQDNEKLSSYTETYYSTTSGVLAVKCRATHIALQAGMEIPQDLILDPILHNGVFNKFYEQQFPDRKPLAHAVLDQDHYWQSGLKAGEEILDLSTKEVMTKIDSLHLGLSNLFSHLFVDNKIPEKFKG